MIPVVTMNAIETEHENEESTVIGCLTKSIGAAFTGPGPASVDTVSSFLRTCLLFSREEAGGVVGLGQLSPLPE